MEFLYIFIFNLKFLSSLYEKLNFISISIWNELPQINTLWLAPDCDKVIHFIICEESSWRDFTLLECLTFLLPTEIIVKNLNKGILPNSHQIFTILWYIKCHNQTTPMQVAIFLAKLWDMRLSQNIFAKSITCLENPKFVFSCRKSHFSNYSIICC